MRKTRAKMYVRSRIHFSLLFFPPGVVSREARYPKLRLVLGTTAVQKRMSLGSSSKPAAATSHRAPLEEPGRAVG